MATFMLAQQKSNNNVMQIRLNLCAWHTLIMFMSLCTDEAKNMQISMFLVTLLMWAVQPWTLSSSYDTHREIFVSENSSQTFYFTAFHAFKAATKQIVHHQYWCLSFSVKISLLKYVEATSKRTAQSSFIAIFAQKVWCLDFSLGFLLMLLLMFMSFNYSKIRYFPFPPYVSSPICEDTGIIWKN